MLALRACGFNASDLVRACLLLALPTDGHLSTLLSHDFYVSIVTPLLLCGKEYFKIAL